MNNFNILTDRWLPVLNGKGEKCIISVKEIINGDYIAISSIKPEFDSIIFIFLFNVFQTIVVKYGVNPKNICLEDLEKFIDDCSEYFYLNGEFPFLQTNIDGAARTLNVISLLPHSQGKNNACFLFGQHEFVLNLCERCIIPSLMLYQWTAPMYGGQISPIFGSSTLFLWLEKTNNMFDNIKFNLMNKNTYLHAFGTEEGKVGDTGFMWADSMIRPDHYSENNEIKAASHSVLYNMWSQCRKIKLVSNGFHICDFCGHTSATYSGFLIGSKFAKLKESGWKHPLHILKDDGILKCGKVDSYGSYDRYAYIIFGEDGYHPVNQNIDDSRNIKLFGIAYGGEQPIKEVVDINLPSINRSNGTKLYIISKNVCKSLTVTLYNRGIKNNNNDISRKFYTQTSKYFYDCLEGFGEEDFNEKDMNRKFKGKCIKTARQIFETETNFLFIPGESAQNGKDSSIKKYIKDWTNFGGKMLPFEYAKKYLTYRSMNTGDKWNLENNERSKMLIALRRGDGRVLAYNKIQTLLENIRHNYKFNNIYNYADKLVGLLLLVNHKEDNIFPVQCKEHGIAEERFLKLFDDHIDIYSKMQIVEDLIKLLLSKQKNKVLETNVNILINILLAQKSNDIKHISCSCFYHGLDKKGENNEE